MEHISVSARALLDQIAKKRVGRTMEALDLAGASQPLKSAIKKQIWEFKNEIESKVLESEGSDEKQDN